MVQERVAGEDGCVRARLVWTHEDGLEVPALLTVEPGQGHTVESRHQGREQTRQVRRQGWDNATHAHGVQAVARRSREAGSASLCTGWRDVESGVPQRKMARS